jgi:hypothetical protein
VGPIVPSFLEMINWHPNNDKTNGCGASHLTSALFVAIAVTASSHHRRGRGC